MKLSTINKFALLQGATNNFASKPLRTVLRWQTYAAAMLALVAGTWAGIHGAISALLGGLIYVVAVWVYAIIVGGRGAKSAGETLRTLIRAEAVKIALIVLQLWLVLTTYHDVVLTVFFASFVISVLLYPMVILVRE